MNFANQCEQWATDYAAHQLGWSVVARNVHSRHGELDLVCRDEEEWVFVEVKGRRGDSFGSGEELVSPAKLRRLHQCIALWMRQHGWAEWRLELWEVHPGPEITRRSLD